MIVTYTICLAVKISLKTIAQINQKLDSVTMNFNIHNICIIKIFSKTIRTEFLTVHINCEALHLVGQLSFWKFLWNLIYIIIQIACLSISLLKDAQHVANRTNSLSKFTAINYRYMWCILWWLVHVQVDCVPDYLHCAKHAVSSHLLSAPPTSSWNCILLRATANGLTGCSRNIHKQTNTRKIIQLANCTFVSIELSQYQISYYTTGLHMYVVIL